MSFSLALERRSVFALMMLNSLDRMVEHLLPVGLNQISPEFVKIV